MESDSLLGSGFRAASLLIFIDYINNWALNLNQRFIYCLILIGAINLLQFVIRNKRFSNSLSLGLGTCLFLCIGLKMLNIKLEFLMFIYLLLFVGICTFADSLLTNRESGKK